MTGAFVYRAPQPDHRCRPFGANGANVGDIWRCDCGNHWRYSHPPSKRGCKVWLPYNPNARRRRWFRRKRDS